MLRSGVLSYQNCKSHGIGVNLEHVQLTVFWNKNSKNHSFGFYCFAIARNLPEVKYSN